jgi:hypothetical protein
LLLRLSCTIRVTCLCLLSWQIACCKLLVIARAGRCAFVSACDHHGDGRTGYSTGSSASNMRSPKCIVAPCAPLCTCWCRAC